MERQALDPIEALYRIVARLESAEECQAFFSDLCTEREIREMAQRLEAAFLLSEGCGYTEIGESVGISTATISRVSKCLKHGRGYRRAIEKERKETV